MFYYHLIYNVKLHFLKHTENVIIHLRKSVRLCKCFMSRMANPLLTGMSLLASTAMGLLIISNRLFKFFTRKYNLIKDHKFLCSLSRLDNYISMAY